MRSRSLGDAGDGLGGAGELVGGAGEGWRQRILGRTVEREGRAQN